MEEIRIINGLIYRAGKLISGEVNISKGKITSKVGPAARVIDAKGGIISPGLIDIHTHGAKGIDINSAREACFGRLCEFYASHGVSGFQASIAADSKENTLGTIKALSPLVNAESGGAKLIGLHLEGPFLNPMHSGAISKEYLLLPNVKLLEEYLSAGKITYMTIAPELEGAIELIKDFSKDTVFSLGHSAADYETLLSAVRAGAKSATHLFNAMIPIHQRRPGIAVAAMDSGIYCEIISDGRHIHPAMIRMAAAFAGYEKLIAVTDSMQAAGMGDGVYTLAGIKVIVKGEDALLENGNRAGSLLTPDRALKNMKEFTKMPFERLIPLFTENPAKLLNIYDRTGALDEGKDADITVFDENMNVRLTMAGGRVVYERE
ncbi:MAG: N-acetylglucosamine-6-phosphate deacetylase [Eubacteriaceae bacterium]|nr:N-acetylglucosamine-6-phosphate deacetylase [Eubacteriaceae bacterium]